MIYQLLLFTLILGLTVYLFIKAFFKYITGITYKIY